MYREQDGGSPGIAEPARGARFDRDRRMVAVSVFSRNATRVEAWFYAQPRGAAEVLRLPLRKGAGDIWSGSITLDELRGLAEGVLYYGYRAWGPNWPFVDGWTSGSALGFVCDVDENGNRFNPNKLLLDPRAREISHDPAARLSTIDPDEFADEYYSGPEHRLADTGPVAPKTVVVLSEPAAPSVAGGRVRRPLKDDIVYELHVRGFTMLDPSIPEQLRGTYRGLALKAPYLRQLGVTAVELLPVFQFANEQNDDGDPRGDNYWGYMTLGYFAANRRYAADQSPGGPAREFRDMVSTLHQQDIKVFLDVVFNHTGEGMLRRTTEAGDSRMDDAKQLPDQASLLSFRGLDNATYYTLRSSPALDGGRRNQRYQDNSACGPSLNVSEPEVRDLIVDSLRYWVDEMKVDGFRFDLGPVLANRLRSDGFVFDWRSEQSSVLQRIGRELPLRSEAAPDGVDLIAEPWDATTGSYLGQFPDGWSEWNDIFRTTLRRAENKLGFGTVLPWEMANAVSGSAQQFRARSAPRPSNSLNYVASHDGLTLRDLFSYTADDAWDHGGDGGQQRKAVRNAFALLATAAGVPMFMAGDELLQSMKGCANAVAIDDRLTWIHWDLNQDQQHTFEFVKELLKLRREHAALRRDRYFTGETAPSGLSDIGWYGREGAPLSGDAWNDREAHFLGFRIDTSIDRGTTGNRSLYVACCWHAEPMEIVLPPNLSDATWRLFADTAPWMEKTSNIDRQQTIIDQRYGLHPRSVAIFVER